MRLFKHGDSFLSHKERNFWESSSGQGVPVSEVCNFWTDRLAYFTHRETVEFGENVKHLNPLISICYNLNSGVFSKKRNIYEAKIRQ